MDWPRKYPVLSSLITIIKFNNYEFRGQFYFNVTALPWQIQEEGEGGGREVSLHVPLCRHLYFLYRVA